MSGKLSNTIHHIFQVQRREKRTFRYDKCFFAILLVRTRVVWLKNGARIPVSVVRNSAKISHVTLSHWHGGIVACHVTARHMRSWVTVGLHSVYFVARASWIIEVCWKATSFFHFLGLEMSFEKVLTLNFQQQISFGISGPFDICCQAQRKPPLNLGAIMSSTCPGSHPEESRFAWILYEHRYKCSITYWLVPESIAHKVVKLRPRQSFKIHLVNRQKFCKHIIGPNFCKAQPQS